MSALDRLRRKIERLDRGLDKKIDEVSASTIKSEARALTLGRRAAEEADRAIERGRVATEKIDTLGDHLTKKLQEATPSEFILRYIVDRPLAVIVFVVVLSCLVTAAGVPKMINNINGDMEVYLPKNDPGAQVAEEVRNENASWSVDILIIYVETPNAWDPTNITNVTDVNVLKEMDYVESRLDYNRTDFGDVDGVRFVLSLSVIVKEVNSTPENFQNALEEMFPGAGAYIGQNANLSGNYSIPDQQKVDDIVDYIPADFKEMLVADSNGDGIYDTTGIFVGLDKDTDQKEFYYDAGELLESAPHNYTRMYLTGPVAITRSLTERTYTEVTIVIPFALAFVFASLLFFHRTWKIVLITAVPIGLSVGLTFGIMGLLDMLVTPQVMVIGPVLIALGVAYGLYIANRYSDERQITDRRERVKAAVVATHRAILLSAITTSIGFASLMTANMAPLKVMGFGLSVGMIISYAVTMVTVPSLVAFLNYEKSGELVGWKKAGEIPVCHRKKIVALSVVLALVSIALIPRIEANMDLVDLSPKDDVTIQKMAEFGEKFGGGQLSMAVLRGSRATDLPEDGSMEDVRVLGAIESKEEEIREGPYVSAMSVVDVMKTVRVPENITINKSRLPPWFPDLGILPDNYTLVTENTSFWDVITQNPVVSRNPSLQQTLVRLFYQSLSVEMRYLLVNQDYSKTLIFVDMPTMDTASTKKVVERINSILQEPDVNLASASPLTGFAPVLVAINDLLLRNAIQTLVIALIAVLLVLSVAFRSLKYAAMTMVPVTLVSIYQPLTLYALRLEMNLLTGIIGSVIVGIGIDFSIHMTERIREHGETINSVKYAVSTSGMSFFEATTTMILGLSSAYIAGIASVNQFVMMISVLLVFSAAGAMLVLPAIYAIRILKG